MAEWYKVLVSKMYWGEYNQFESRNPRESCSDFHCKKSRPDNLKTNGSFQMTHNWVFKQHFDKSIFIIGQLVILLMGGWTLLMVGLWNPASQLRMNRPKTEKNITHRGQVFFVGEISQVIVFVLGHAPHLVIADLAFQLNVVLRRHRWRRRRWSRKIVAEKDNKFIAQVFIIYYGFLYDI